MQIGEVIKTGLWAKPETGLQATLTAHDALGHICDRVDPAP